jgi:hypothetical protein
MSKNYHRLDKETKKAIAKTTALFFEEGVKSFFEVGNISTRQFKYKK